MKVRQASAAAMAVASANAQSLSAYPYASESPVSYVTVTYDFCSSVPIETMITVTNGYTVTYCPECSKTPSAVPTPPGHTTVYTTEYLSLCSTGLVPVTHTITESCTEATPTWTPGPSHLPPGFTVTVKDCTVCSGAHPTKPVSVTITEPCDCEATSGTSLGPLPTGTPVQQIPDGQIQNPAPTGTPVQQIPDGQIQNPAPTPGSPGNTPTGPGATNPTVAPYPTTTTVKCPGPACIASTMPTGTGAVPVPADSTSSPAGGASTPVDGTTPPAGTSAITPPAYTGSASSSSHAAFGFATLAMVIGTLAFAL
ncbi:uncharacterized protein SEPMUDRAFT_119854 [Sphaerulina musiva SO2202]|uniref:Uncharacterized protein n=1 Tax=Sphaerulina musiva (strain SO2202) TaxID=692275 RepID=M3D0W5_SPHMS|nr:uncharacterized protein SEPMUDRAFT_119854 [Sphaerulina musiva SO2202]EMF10133.1 hypothetical protein SEPMUDRAFT_119854 [Sphaerulina musiva SO2202]